MGRQICRWHLWPSRSRRNIPVRKPQKGIAWTTAHFAPQIEAESVIPLLSQRCERSIDRKYSRVRNWLQVQSLHFGAKNVHSEKKRDLGRHKRRRKLDQNGKTRHKNKGMQPEKLILISSLLLSHSSWLQILKLSLKASTTSAAGSALLCLYSLLLAGWSLWTALSFGWSLLP